MDGVYGASKSRTRRAGQHEPASCRAGIERLAARHRQDPEADLLGVKLSHDIQKVGNASLNPVQLGADELVPFADVSEGSFKLLAFSYG